MRALAEYYDTVLVVGGEGCHCREVAEQYGFKVIIVPNDIVAWDPTIAPYRVFTKERILSGRRPAHCPPISKRPYTGSCWKLSRLPGHAEVDFWLVS